MKKEKNPEILNKMSKDPGNWKGPFYINRKDPRLAVPKQKKAFGFTLNFASPFSYIFILVLVLVILWYSFS